MRITLAAGALALAVCGVSFEAAAALVSCPSTAITSDREFTLDTSSGASCFGSGPGNISGNLPNDGFLALHPGYVLLDKSDDGLAYAGTSSEFTSFTGTGTLSGSFTFVAPAGYHNFVLALKSGQGQANPDWAAFSLPTGVLGGCGLSLILQKKSDDEGGQSLSHANLYALPGVAATPVPGALWLMGTVLASGLDWCWPLAPRSRKLLILPPRSNRGRAATFVAA
jgi:hypothetical protein